MEQEDYPFKPGQKDQVRTFATGATRSQDSDRPDYEGYLSPLVIERFGSYMKKHRIQADGKVRDSDNWQLGMPLKVFAKGLLRHIVHFWTRHRGFIVHDPLAAESIQEDLCAIIFNAQGYLHQLLVKSEYTPPDDLDSSSYNSTFSGGFRG